MSLKVDEVPLKGKKGSKTTILTKSPLYKTLGSVNNSSLVS